MAWREEASLGHVKVRKLETLNASFTIGTEAANVINVAIQLKDGVEQHDVTRAMALRFYLSSDSAGQVPEPNASGPDAIAIGTDGALIKDGNDSLVSGLLVFEADGDADLNITHSGADTFYLNLVTPDGSLITSGAITFDATT